MTQPGFKVTGSGFEATRFRFPNHLEWEVGVLLIRPPGLIRDLIILLGLEAPATNQTIYRVNISKRDLKKHTRCHVTLAITCHQCQTPATPDENSQKPPSELSEDSARWLNRQSAGIACGRLGVRFPAVVCLFSFVLAHNNSI